MKESVGKLAWFFTRKHEKLTVMNWQMNTRHKVALEIVVIIAIFMAFVFLYPSFFTYLGDKILAPFGLSVDGIHGKYFAEEASGTIYLSLLPNPPEENPVHIYTFDLEQQTLSPLTSDNYFQYVTSKISPDGAKIAYGRASLDDPALRMFVSAVDDMENGTEILPEIGSKVKRNPVWSPDGSKIAFMVRDDSNGAAVDTTGWYVYVYDFNTQEGRFVAEGINPLFAPNGQVLVLQADGLYMFDLSQTDVVGSRIWTVEDGSALQTMKLAISPDGSMIAWTAAGHNTMTLLEVHSWGPFIGTIKATISSDGFWPIFSPDNRFMAYQEVDVDGDVITSPRLVVYDIARGTSKVIYDLKDFVQEAMFITDWR